MTPDPLTEEPVRNPDGLDPRAEEIRAALEDIAPNSWIVTDVGRVLNDARPDRGRFIAQARDNGLARFIAESPRRLAYLLDRNKALEDVADAAGIASAIYDTDPGNDVRFDNAMRDLRVALLPLDGTI